MGCNFSTINQCLLTPICNCIIQISEITRKIANRFRISGPLNMQFLVTADDVMVIELNLRASRSCPFVSKTIGTDLVKVATQVMMGKGLDISTLPTLENPHNPIGYVGIKVNSLMS